MQVKSFAIWANAEKNQVPALVQSTLKWANENNLEVYLADRLKSIDVDSEVSYFSSQNPPEVDFLLCFGGDGTLISGVRIWKFLIGGIVVIISIPLLLNFLKPYQKDRLISFLNPDEDALGRGYQLIQSKILSKNQFL